MNILLQRFKDQLMRGLTDDNKQDSLYYAYYARKMRELGVNISLNCQSVSAPKNPNSKTIGDIHGIKGIYSISVRIDNYSETTEESENISAVILKSFQIIRQISAGGSETK